MPGGKKRPCSITPPCTSTPTGPSAHQLSTGRSEASSSVIIRQAAFFQKRVSRIPQATPGRGWPQGHKGGLTTTKRLLEMSSSTRTRHSATWSPRQSARSGTVKAGPAWGSREGSAGTEGTYRLHCTAGAGRPHPDGHLLLPSPPPTVDHEKNLRGIRVAHKLCVMFSRISGSQEARPQ